MNFTYMKFILYIYTHAHTHIYISRRFDELEAAADQGRQALEAVEQKQRALKTLRQDIATLSANNTGVANVLPMCCQCVANVLPTCC